MPGEGMEALPSPTYLTYACLSNRSSVSSIISFNKWGNLSVSLRSVSCSSKLIQSLEGVIGTSAL